MNWFDRNEGMRKKIYMLGESCFIVGGMGLLLTIVIGIPKIIEYGSSRLVQMGFLLTLTIPIFLIGLYLIKKEHKENPGGME